MLHFLLKAGKYKIAVRYYQRIVDYLKNEESLKDEEADKRKALLLAAHLNLAMCHLKLSEDLDACQSCDEALALDPKNEKGLFRRGMVCGNVACCIMHIESVTELVESADRLLCYHYRHYN